jgi:hypothetical protein
MTVPDQELIAEVLLASEGFSAAQPLARKAVALFALAREGCTAQRHYDWGLRALKTSLGAAGKLLREVRWDVVLLTRSNAAASCPVLYCCIQNGQRSRCANQLRYVFCGSIRESYPTAPAFSALVCHPETITNAQPPLFGHLPIRSCASSATRRSH